MLLLGCFRDSNRRTIRQNARQDGVRIASDLRFLLLCIHRDAMSSGVTSSLDALQRSVSRVPRRSAGVPVVAQYSEALRCRGNESLGHALLGRRTLKRKCVSCSGGVPMPGRISASAVLALLGVLALRTADASQPTDRPTRFSVAVSGHGPDVVLIPGLATPGDVWDVTVKQLASSHRVHVVQVAGFGGADGGINRADGDMLPALVAEMAQYLVGLERPAVIGHSLGGLIALEVAARTPDAVGRVLVVDALPFFALTMSPGATVEMAKQMATMIRNQLMAQTDTQYAASVPMTTARLAKSPTARATVTKWTAASDRTVVAKAMYEDVVTDARPRLPQIKAKTIVLYAFDSTMGVPQAAIDALYSGAYADLPGVDLKRIDGSYHFIMLDQPDAFSREVDAFLK
jgi:pimeloyl-ACP methyl ester carboxylesterase